ncbi:MAG: hypothetical protein RIC52_00770 [Amphiplicatus sp.]
MMKLLQRKIVGAATLLLAVAACGKESAPASTEQGASPLAFDGALGWAAATPGGRGGQIIKVTSLAAHGPGSLREAVEAKGPRIIVFEVGGVIDLDLQTLRIEEPFVTIAGQTAPSPGITIIRGGVDIAAHDVVVQHLRIRSGQAGQGPGSRWEADTVSTQAGAYNVIVDHCSLTWAIDENLSASGPRFTGETPEDWREGTSHDITFSNNIIAEGLSNATHPKFEHSKGSLIHDNVSNILIYGNLYAHNYERNPLFKGGVRGVIVNNLIYNPGQRALHYNLQALEWGDVAPLNGRMTAVGNVFRGGQSTVPDLPFLMIGGDGDLDFHGRDNIAVDHHGRPAPMFGRYTTSAARIIEHEAPLDWPEGLEALPAEQVQAFVLANAGARPWDRDGHDVRILADTAEGRGEIIDSEQQIGGYPAMKETRRAFDASLWNLDTMQPRSPDALDSGAKARGT